jgi:acyl carrier protein
MSVKLYDIVSQVMNVPVSRINDGSGPESIETWDSFHGLVLLDDLETTYNVKFSIDEVLSIKTVADIKRNLQNHGILLDG